MEYAHGVLDESIPACLFVKQACQRQINDLERSLDPHFPYRFDEAAADRICWFMSSLPHVSGPWARPVYGIVPRIKLEPWQCFILCCIFGWLQKTNGVRRFTRVYEEVNRKNAKSTMAAGIGLYMLCADNEMDAQVFSGATKEKQALEVFRPARLMALRTTDLRDSFGLEIAKKSISRSDGSRFEPLVRNPGDGSSPSCAIIDEYHEHETSTLSDAMQTGMGSRPQPLHFTITTAGFNVGGPCYMLRGDAVKVLSGAAQDDHFFAIIYTLDEGDDWKDPKNWPKANPNQGISVSAEYIAGQVQIAENFPHRRGTILTKHFGIWSNAAKPWMPMERWQACANTDWQGKPRTLQIADFRGEACWHGADLGAKIDLASRSLVFKRREADQREHYYIFGYHYVPKVTAFDGDHGNYEQWVIQQKMIACDGPEISLLQIQRDIESDAKLYDMQCLAFDPWQAQQMQEGLEQQFGDTVVLTVPQKAEYFSDPMKELQAAVFSGRVHHDGDPVLTWAMSNVEVKEGINETIYPRKGPDERLKIDPVAALITAMNRAYTAPVIEKYTRPYVRVC